MQALSTPSATLKMVELRASRINGCSFCVEMQAGELREAGESDERIAARTAAGTWQA